MKKLFWIMLCTFSMMLYGCGNVEQSDEYRSLQNSYEVLQNEMEELRLENEELKRENTTLQAEKYALHAAIYIYDDLCSKKISPDYMDIVLEHYMVPDFTDGPAPAEQENVPLIEQNYYLNDLFIDAMHDYAYDKIDAPEDYYPLDIPYINNCLIEAQKSSTYDLSDITY